MPEERRKHPRLDLNLPAGLSSGLGSDPQRARLRNISRGGANFVSDEPVSRGEWVEFMLGDGLSFRGQVVRADSRFVGGFAVRFTDEREPGAGNGVAGSANGKPRANNGYQLELKSLKEDAFWYYERLERVRGFVTANYAEPITLGEAARVAAMERTYFSYFFRRKLGVTFTSWLQYIRIGKALEMLASKNHSVTEVAFAVGFNELSTFQKAFKRWTNLTPREFKRLARPA